MKKSSAAVAAMLALSEMEIVAAHRGDDIVGASLHSGWHTRRTGTWSPVCNPQEEGEDLWKEQAQT